MDGHHKMHRALLAFALFCGEGIRVLRVKARAPVVPFGFWCGVRTGIDGLQNQRYVSMV